MQSSRRLRGRLACLAAGTAVAAFGFASTASAYVAIFDNPEYVDTANDDNSSEADNLQATVGDLGVPFTTFTGVTADEVGAAPDAAPSSSPSRRTGPSPVIPPLPTS